MARARAASGAYSAFNREYRNRRIEAAAQGRRFMSYQRTQATLAKSRKVLTAALRQPEVAHSQVLPYFIVRSNTLLQGSMSLAEANLSSGVISR